MNNFQIFANHRILDSNLHYCLYVTDDHIPVNDSVFHCTTMSSEIISSPNIAINNVRSTCEEVFSPHMSAASAKMSASMNSIYFIEVFISSKKRDTYIY